METEITRETLVAFLDGELPPKEMEQIAAQLAVRPDLDAWVRRQEKLRSNLKQAFSDVVAEPPPQKLLAAVRDTPVSKRWLLRHWLAPWKPRSWAPIGAALVAGLAIGIVLRPSSEFISTDGQILAGGVLADALDHKLASSGYDGLGTRIGISFRDHTGHDCRTFDQDSHTGLACHQVNGWAITILDSHPGRTGGAYHMAGSEMPNPVRQAVMARIEGVPFDAAAEKTARDRGWK